MESDFSARRPTASGIGLAKNADVLLHDGQFRTAEYAARRGSGHSSVTDALAFAALADVGRLVLFHHDPGRTDDALEGVLDEAMSQTRVAPEDVILARQGDVLIPGRPAAAVTAS
jgi:ribonuclease BN (tRNA processing enzyme)